MKALFDIYYNGTKLNTSTPSMTEDKAKDYIGNCIMNYGYKPKMIKKGASCMAIVDTVVTNKHHFLTVFYVPQTGQLTYKRYYDVVDQDRDAANFVKTAISIMDNVEIKMIVADCAISYLPSFYNLFTPENIFKDITLSRRSRFAHLIESKITRLKSI
ncbi:hypothetical protein QT327_21405 [Olivibacter sp. 47]|uniref:hypothetical protein n=1 Tax=Olivibacter sp. 47 TaxID=3056486 RepID=UPI0025A3CAA3|nr:hypothetical protein [Olivibacter sp. 47]MDM8176874.1 hypothetical protein [Olivibacter sp. 47]